MVALGSPAVLGSFRIRDFLPLPYSRFGFNYHGIFNTKKTKKLIKIVINIII